MKKIQSVSLVILAVFFISVITGCTTATYGNNLTPAGNDTYTMKIYVGGPLWVGESGSLPRVKKEAETFMAEHPEYKYFEVISTRKNFIPSYYEYKIKYFKSEQDSMIFQGALAE